MLQEKRSGSSVLPSVPWILRSSEEIAIEGRCADHAGREGRAWHSSAEIVKLRHLIFVNQMFEDREHVGPVLVHLRRLGAMAAVLNLKLVQVEGSRKFIQVGRIRV